MWKIQRSVHAYLSYAISNHSALWFITPHRTQERLLGRSPSCEASTTDQGKFLQLCHQHFPRRDHKLKH